MSEGRARARPICRKDISGPGYQQGRDLFRDQLRQVPKHLTGQQIKEAFAALYARIETAGDTLDGLSLVQKAELLAKDFPICAYGYPRTYMSILAGDVTMEKLQDLLPP